MILGDTGALGTPITNRSAVQQVRANSYVYAPVSFDPNANPSNLGNNICASVRRSAGSVLSRFLGVFSNYAAAPLVALGMLSGFSFGVVVVIHSGVMHL